MNFSCAFVPNYPMQLKYIRGLQNSISKLKMIILWRRATIVHYKYTNTINSVLRQLLSLYNKCLVNKSFENCKVQDEESLNINNVFFLLL